jgi:amino acid transporter
MSTALPGDHQLTSSEHNKLKAGTIGLFGVLFMALANAAPITAMTGNVPIAVAFGNGVYAPAGFVVATIVLTLFTIGFVSMARYITTTGAFYGFISHGLGQIWGMATGFLATMCYIVFEGSLIGIFAYFASQAINTWTGATVNWLLIAVVGIILVGVFGYFDISIAAKLLGFFLICEVVLLAALSFSVLFKGGGPDGLMADIVNPLNAFKSLPEGGGTNPAVMVGSPAAPIAAGAAALGVFFAFWSWIGFETTAVYGEESRNPRHIVPRATLIAVVGLGIFYSFVSWMVIAGNGANAAITKSYTNAITMFTDLAAANLGGAWVVNVYLFLIVSGSFACALAFHNAASRYLYAIGREVPALRGNLGTTHSTHGSPHISSIVQTVLTLVITVLFYLLTPNGSDVLQGGYIYEYGLLALLGTMAILLVMAICSLAVIWYFWVKKVHTGNVFTTLISPALGFLGMLYVVYLLLSNITFAGGGAAGSAFFVAIPWMTIATFVAGLVFALWIKNSQPEVYAEIGRTTLEEAHERV